MRRLMLQYRVDPQEAQDGDLRTCMHLPINATFKVSACTCAKMKHKSCRTLSSTIPTSRTRSWLQDAGRSSIDVTPRYGGVPIVPIVFVASQPSDSLPEGLTPTNHIS